MDFGTAPKTLSTNLDYRAALLAECDTPARRKAALERCRHDLVWYVDSFCWQYNPQHVNAEVGPFLLWPFQESALERTRRQLFQERDDILWEKSRELGATWLALILFDWMCLFHESKSFLCISHTEHAVDKPAEPGTLFWKVRFLHERLPDWLSRGVIKRKLSFEYPATHSTLTGSATSERSGVGGRYTALLLDEFSKHQAAREIYGQTADTGPRLFIGTHYGTAGKFFELTQRKGTIDKVVMHWSEHPEKRVGLYRARPGSPLPTHYDSHPFPPDYPYVLDGAPTGGPHPGLRSVWYDREVRRRESQRDVACHLDIDPIQSQSSVFDRLLILRLQETVCCDPYWEGELEFDRDAATPLRLVKRAGGRLRLWLHLRSATEVPEGVYVFGADLSQGTGATNTCLAGADALTGEKVLEWCDPHEDGRPDRIAPLAVALCRLFHNAKLGWEIPGPGVTFGREVMRLGHHNVYYRTQNLTLESGKRAEEPGWLCTATTKAMLINEYMKALAGGDYLNRSKEALDETLFFRYKSGGEIEHSGESESADPSGARSNHGDRVIADGLAWMLARKEGLSARDRRVQEQRAPTLSLQWRRDLHAAQQTAADGWAG